MPKSSKRFILSNEKLNSHGFVVITSGIDLSNFVKNPVMYWLHQYPNDDNADECLPIGYWDEIQVAGAVLTAVPVFDDSDEFAMKIYHKVEHGTLRSASIAIDPVQVDNNRENWVEGQKLPTVLKSVLTEASIVDRPSNSDAVTLNAGGTNIFLALNGKRGQTQTLTEPEKPVEPKLPTVELSPEILAVIENAVQAGKFTKLEADSMLSIATKDASVEDAIKKIVKNARIKPENIKGKYHHTLIDQAANNSYDEIQRNVKGGFNFLKAGAPELYKAKFFEKHGRLPAVV